jgi:hypothetical protein
MKARNFLPVSAVALLSGLAGCTTSATDALDLRSPPSANLQYPNINVVPSGATPQMTPAEEADLLTALNAELDARRTLSPAELAAYNQRKRRLAELARTNRAVVEKAIESR